MGGWVVCTTGPEEVNAQAVSRGRHEVSKDPATPPNSAAPRGAEREATISHVMRIVVYDVTILSC